MISVGFQVPFRGKLAKRWAEDLATGNGVFGFGFLRGQILDRVAGAIGALSPELSVSVSLP
jgi:hypothetical protein